MSQILSDNTYGGTRGERATLNPSLRSFLKAEYDLDKNSEFLDLGGGCNLNLKVSHSGKNYVIRVYRPWTKRQRVDSLQQIQNILSSEIPVPQKLTTKSGQLLCEWEGRIIEADEFITYSEKMDNWDRLGSGMYILGRLHSLLQGEHYGLLPEDNKYTNYVSLGDVRLQTMKACERMRSWKNLSGYEREVIDLSQKLCELVAAHPYELPAQPTHGDFWDNNVLFDKGRVSFVADFDFMGIRNRIDDLALTFYFTDAQFMLYDPYTGDRLAQFSRLVSNYNQGLNEPLSWAEKEALPYAMARQPLWGIGNWVYALDCDDTARAHMSDMLWYLKWGISMIENADGWREKVFI